VSYNEEQQKAGTIKHIFIPSSMGLIYETSLSALALLLVGLTFIGKQIHSLSPESDPVSFATSTVRQGWDFINQFYSVQQVMIFLLWAFFGMAVYVIFFKIFQLAYGAIYQLRKGVEYVHEDHAHGAIKWLGSLQDTILKFLIWLVGSAAIFIGIVVCFSYAATHLKVAVSESLPNNLLYFGIAFLAAFIGLRLVMIGLCFLLPSFRRWYAV
jgi:hypothetical protein